MIDSARRSSTLKSFIKKWHKGEVTQIIQLWNLWKCLLSYQVPSIKIVRWRLMFNGQYSEAHEINVHRGFLFGPSFILHYINEHPENILRSLWNIYAESSTIYGCTVKHLDDSSLEAKISSSLAWKAQWWENDWSTQYLQIQTSDVISPLSRPPIFSAVPSIKLFALNLYWDSS